MPDLYLTIDDGPSEKFTALANFLAERGVPAVFFNRGDMMEKRPEAVIYAIKKGYIMANHAYSHKRASTLSYEGMCAEILRTEEILDDLYTRAGVDRPGKYFRFPYLDRGMGPWLAEPGHLDETARRAQEELLEKGLGHNPEKPGLERIEKKRKLQQFLKETGFDILPVENVTLPWYARTEMAKSIDSLCSYSTSDWALSKRHKGKQSFDTIEDLKRKIDDDPWLHDERSNHIVLAHDQADIHDVTCALVDYFLESGFKFLDFRAERR